MSELIRYEAARAALAEAHRVDEVKDIRDRAEAMAAYARQAKDTKLIEYATEIKVRAERKVGQMLRDTQKNPGAKGNPGGRGARVVRSHDGTAQTLNEMGLTKNESSRYQALASMSEEQFDAAVETAKAAAGEVTTAYLVREAKKASGKEKKPASKNAAPKPDAKPVVVDAENEHVIQLEAANSELSTENDDLRAKLAVAHMDATPEEREAAATLIAELRDTVAGLQRDLRAIKASRDGLLIENGELKKQVAYWRKRAEKVAA